MSKGYNDLSIMIDLQGFLEPKEVKKLIKAATNKRDKLLLKVLAYTGRRVSEVVGLRILDKKGHIKHNEHGLPLITGGLKPQDIDAEHKQILWNIVKKGKPRKAWIPTFKEMIDELTNYINAMNIKEDKRVFNISRQRVFQIIRRAGKRAGIGLVGSKMIHPHHLRHSYAITLLRKGVPIYKIKKLLDHSSVLITEAYLKVAPEDVRSSVELIADVYGGGVE